MAKPNYSFEKRKRDLAKQQKKEAKRLKKLDGRSDSAPTDPDSGDSDTTDSGPAAENSPPDEKLDQ